jgi:hypothetical protein
VQYSEHISLIFVDNRVIHLKEKLLYAPIHAFFKGRGWPYWTEREIRGIRDVKVIPDAMALNEGIMVAVEAEPDVSSESLNHGVGQTRRFSAFAGILYLALPVPVSKATTDELRLISPGTGLLEVNVAKRRVRERIKPAKRQPASLEKARRLFLALRGVTMKRKHREEARLRGVRRRNLWLRLHHIPPFNPDRPSLIGNHIDTDENNRLVRVEIQDPPEFTLSEPVSIEYDREHVREFVACCYEIKWRLEYADAFNFFGANTKVELFSEVFCVREDCGHVGSSEFCPLCGSRPVDDEITWDSEYSED